MSMRLRLAMQEVLRDPQVAPRKLQSTWARLWLPLAGLSPAGRMAARLATWFAPPYKARRWFADVHPRGFVSPRAAICHRGLRLGLHVFIGDDVTIIQMDGGGPVEIGDKASVWGDALLETGERGGITIGPESRINLGVHLISYVAPIRIGRDVGIGEGSALFSYNHGIAPGRPYMEQPLQSKGPIVIDDHAWVGLGSIVLDGVRIGKGAIVGAGSVVTRDVPDGAIAVGVPARVVGMRGEPSWTAAAPPSWSRTDA